MRRDGNRGEMVVCGGMWLLWVRRRGADDGVGDGDGGDCDGG